MPSPIFFMIDTIMRIYPLDITPEYWHTLTTYHFCLKIWTSYFYHLLMCLKPIVLNSVDSDQTLWFAASDLGLHSVA